MKKDSKSESSANLRKQAEALNRKRSLKSSPRLDDTKMRKLIQELEIHQIELELQNKELLKAKAQITADAEKYAELYDFAPSGYFTLANNGEIIELNLCGSQMLGKERTFLKTRRFNQYVNDDSKPAFDHFLDKVFTYKSTETCEVALTVNGDLPMYVSLSGTVSANDEQCLVIATDITDRKMAEEALHENDEKYRLLLENTNTGIGVYGLDGTILWYNPIAIKNIGRKAGDVIGKTLADIFGAQAAQVFCERILLAAQSDHSIEYEELVQLDAGYRWYLSDYRRIKDPDGEIRSVQVMAHDITDRKKVEEALRETNELFSLFMKHSPIFTFIKEVGPLESRVLKASENYMEMLGFSGSEIEGKTMYELFPHELAAKLTADDWKVVSNGEILKVDEDLNGRNYTSIKFPITLGGKTLLAGYTIDITERIRKEDEIRKVKEHFKALIEKAPDGIVLLDAEGNFRFISPAAKRIFGLQQSEQFIGHPEEYTHPDDLKMVLSAVSRIIEDPTYIPTLEYRFRDKTGNWLWVESTFTNLLADPSVESILINFRNITERKQAEEALRQSNIQLKLAHTFAGAGTWDWDMTSQRLIWSKELYVLFGLDPQSAEATFDTWNLVVYPDDLAYASKCIEQAINEKTPLNSEYRVLHPNGQVHWINALGNTTYDDSGQPIRMVGLCTDVTARRLAEEALHASEEQYARLFNNFLDGVAVHQIVLDETGKPVDYILLQANASFETHTGLRVADIQGKRASEVFPGIGESPLIGIYGKVTLTGEPVILEQFFEPLQRYFHVSAFNIGEGRFCTVFQDVTATRIAEKALKESEERFRTIFEKSIVGKSMTTLDGKMQVNQAFCAMLGYTKDQLAKTDWTSITHPDDVKNDQAIVQTIISGERTSARWSKRYLHKNGSSVWVDINTTLQRDNNENPLYFSTAVIDITEQRKAEELLLKSEERYRSLMTNLEAGVVVHAADTSIIMNNHRASELLGLSDDQMRGKLAFDPDWKFVDENNVPFLPGEYPVNRILATKKPFSNCVLGVIQSESKNTVWLTVNGFPVTNAQGEIEEVLISFIDITERKTATKALLLKNLVFDTSIAANSIAGLDGKITEVNDAFLRMWGYSKREEISGRSIIDFLYHSKEGDVIIKALAEKGVWEGDYTARKKDGTTFMAHSLATTLKDSRNEVIGYQSSVIDISGRIESEIKLKTSETKFRNLVWDMQAGVLLQGPESEMLLCNPKALELLGITENQLLGKTSFDPDWNVIHEDGSPFPGADHPVPQAIATRRPVRNVVMGVYHPLRGNRAWLLVDAKPQLDRNGEVQQVICTFVDITERKRAEEALIESERKFRETITNLDEGYYSVTMDGALIEHNQAFSRILGFETTADLKGIHLTDFWQHPDKRKKYLDAILATGSVSNYQISVISRTGEKKTVLANAHLVKDVNAQLQRIEGIFLDITERIRAEEALHRHTERLQNLHKIDKAILSPVETPEAIILKALQHIRILLSSQHASIGIFDFENEALQIFTANIKDGSINKSGNFMIDKAYGDLELLRKNRMDVVEDISMKSSPHELLKVLRSEGIMSCINVPLISGEKLIGAMNLGWGDPRSFTPEELEIASEVADEITIAIEQVRLRQVAKHYAEDLEKRVEDRTSQLLAANKELEAFSYSVSHDLRAPLRHINGYISILSKHLKDTLPEKEKHYFDTIADSAHQMGVLIDDLLNFSRTGRQEMKLTNLDMNIVLQDALQVIKHESNGRNIKWEIAQLPRAVGDYALLRLVWLNLLSNAVKFSAGNIRTQIEVGVVDKDREFVFFVRDNGAGFDMQYAQKLFGVFERLHSAQEFEGTGIGLANVRRIILRHGGRVWAEAEVGKGATFYFSLPKG